MKHISKIIAVVLFVALVLSACTVVRPTMFKGKSASEWENDFKSTPTISLVKTSEPSDELKDFSLHIEGEDRESDTISGVEYAYDSFSGGKALRANYTRNDSVTHAVNFTVNVPQTGSYSLIAVTTNLSQLSTTDYDIYINDTFAYSAADSVISTEATSIATVKKFTLESVSLTEGDNKLSFVLQNTDRQPNKPSFFLDYFELAPDKDAYADGDVRYTATPSGDYSKQATAAAELDVYTGSWDMSLECTVSSFASTEEQTDNVNVEIADYYGNSVFSEIVKPTFGYYSLNADLGKHPTGYFTLKATVGTKTLFTKDYVVLPAVEDRDLESDSPFASDFASYHILDLDVTDNYAAVAKLAGISVLRERLDWTEWTQGRYDFSRADSYYNAISDMGMEIEPFISSAPNWVTDTGKKIYMQSQLEMYEFTKRAAQRYKDISQAMEIWNETNWFVGVPADVYASFLKTACLAVVDGTNGELPKIVGGLCEGNGWSSAERYINILYANEIFDYSDAFNWHYHIYDTTPEKAVTEFTDGTPAGNFAAFANEKLSSLPSWCTEAGIKLYPKTGEDLSFSQQKIQANYMVTSVCQSLAAGTDKHFWFIYAKFDEEKGWFGSFGSKNQPFASVVTESIITQTLGKGIYKGELKGLASGAEGHVINNGEDDVIVLWASSDTDITLSVPGNVLKTTVVGNREVLVPQNGKITVTASSEPMFITLDGTADTSVYTATKNDAPITISARSDYNAGDRVVLTQLWYDTTDLTSYLTARDSGYKVSSDGSTVTLQIVNLNDFEVKGTVSGSADGYTFTTDSTEITVPAMSKTEITFKVTPSDSSAGRTYLTVQGIFNGFETSKSVSEIYK